jgi:hypothetical protein
MAVNKFTNGAGDNTWGTAGNWSQGTVPISTDGHVTTFDGTSPNCTVNASNRSCGAIDFTGYTNTITMTFAITCVGNITFASGMSVSGAGGFTSGKSGGGSATITSNGFTWPNNFTVGGSGGGSWTITLVGDLIISGLLTQNGAHAIVWNKTTSEKLYANGGLTVAINSTSGDLYFVLGGGTLTMTATNGWPYDTELAGNVTVSGNVYYRTGTLKYTSGTVTVTSSTLNLTASCTLDTAGMDWNIITTTTTTSQTYTINSTLSAATLNLGTTTSQTFEGTAGFTVGTLSCSATGAQTINLKESVTYTITSSLSCFTSRVGSIVLFTSSHASTKAIITLTNNVTTICNVLANFTRIDASGGRTINGFNSVITDCINIREYHDLQTVAA